MCQPGTIFEIETFELNGRQLRTWKHVSGELLGAAAGEHACSRAGEKDDHPPGTSAGSISETDSSQQDPHWRAFIEPRMKQFANQEFVSSPLPLPATHEEREHVSYGEMLRRGYVIGAWLRARGAGVGTRVAIGGINSAEWVAAFVGCHLIGAVPVLLNSTLHPDAQLHCLALTEPEVVFVDANLANVLGGIGRAALKQKKVGEVYCWSSIAHLPAAVRHEVSELITPVAPAKLVSEVEQGTGLESLGPESDAIIFFTSG